MKVLFAVLFMPLWCFCQQSGGEKMYNELQQKIAEQKRQDSLVQLKNRNKAIRDSLKSDSGQKAAKEYNKMIDAQWAEREIKNKVNREAKTRETKAKETARREKIIKLYGANSAAILNHEVRLSWTKQMCIESWGRPKEINKTIVAGSVNEQWVYTIKKYLYFENEKLTGIQE